MCTFKVKINNSIMTTITLLLLICKILKQSIEAINFRNDMKKIVFLLIQIIFILPSLAQEIVKDSNPNNTTRQGFGTHESFDMAVGFVNAKTLTEGSAYYFDDWNTEGIIYIKDKGRVKINKVNINLYDSKLEAIYDENSVFTFDSENLIKIVINDKVFRIFEIDNELKIFELFFNDKFSIYKHYSIFYAQASINPMVNRKTNKYIKKTSYYLYQEGKLSMMKLSKKSFSKLLQSDNVSQESIIEYIEKNQLSLNEETDLIQVLKFVSE